MPKFNTQSTLSGYNLTLKKVAVFVLQGKKGKNNNREIFVFEFSNREGAQPQYVADYQSYDDNDFVTF